MIWKHLQESRDYRLAQISTLNFYLGVTKSYYFDIVNLKEEDESVLPEDIFILKNCGDILYKPYFYKINKM